MGKNYPGTMKSLRTVEEEFQEQQEYLRGLPARMLMAAARARKLGCSVSLEYTDLDTPEVELSHESGQDYTLNFDTEAWEMEACEDWLNFLEDEKKRKQDRFNLAKSAAAKLSKEELAALREFGYI